LEVKRGARRSVSKKISHELRHHQTVRLPFLEKVAGHGPSPAHLQARRFDKCRRWRHEVDLVVAKDKGRAAASAHGRLGAKQGVSYAKELKSGVLTTSSEPL
jgi:hypothetical protein